jgi:hypothetical protein
MGLPSSAITVKRWPENASVMFSVVLALSSRCVHHLEAVVGRRPAADILHADPGALPVVGRQQHFLIVAAGIARQLDDEEAVEPCILLSSSRG